VQNSSKATAESNAKLRRHRRQRSSQNAIDADKPHICDLDNCGNRFRLPKDLIRHQKSVHMRKMEQLGVTVELCYCPYEGCRFYNYHDMHSRGMVRKDNMDKHIRKQHENKGIRQGQEEEEDYENDDDVDYS
jgi:hypothetical protein